jgi:O-succinylbenzoate synthase
MRPITISDIKIYPIAVPLVEPLRTSFGIEAHKAGIIVELITDDGITGWGEISVSNAPGYGSETVGTAKHIVEQFIRPMLLNKTIETPTQYPDLVHSVRGNHHTRAGVEYALWDAFAKANDLRLTDLFAAMLPEGHASEGKATVGVSIGIQPTVEDTLDIIKLRLDQGYERIKLKIKRGWDVELARGVRGAMPDITVMVDANSDYTLADAEHLKQLDEYNLLMIEQPLSYDDIYEHGKLQPQLKTPICLDESIKTARDLKLAIQIGAIKILNLKPARVGGFTESLKIYEVCVENNLPLWVGGMLETGVGRAATLSFASLPGVNMPSDISATDRYYDPDITEPAFKLGEGSTLSVVDAPGIGVTVQRDRLEEAAARWVEDNPYGG